MARGRMPGPGGMDMGALMKQAQQMQADMAKAQEELKDEVVDASAGGGMVKVKVSGDLFRRGRPGLDYGALGPPAWFHAV